MGLLEKTINKLDSPAILIGNGINLCADLFPSWDKLLKKRSGISFKSEGLTNTEIYDFIDLKTDDGVKLKYDIAKSFENDPKKNSEIHKKFMDLVIKKDCPILTTNFDFTLEHTLLPTNGSFYRTAKEGFTRFYPWDTYFGQRQHDLPTDGFGIWHIHGMINYFDSIRLGLTDYMGSVEKARKLIHKGDDKLFGGKNQNNWDGRKTWLHIWFNKPLIIVGLKLNTDEVFIRWLFIEREKYFKKFPDRRKKTFYLSKGDSPHLDSFLDNLDIKLSKSSDYDSLYC
jgi:hypothetical protein